MIEFSLWDIVRNLLLAARWTVLLSLLAVAATVPAYLRLGSEFMPPLNLSLIHI